MEWIFIILEKAIWFGFAAVGFAVLFNVPVRTLFSIWLLGAAGGITKLLLMHFGQGIIIASLSGSTMIGLISIAVAHRKHSPPLIFAIPAVIPMVPGILAYRMILGLIALAGELKPDAYIKTLSETATIGLKVLFVLMSLAAGVAIPLLITRKESAKELKLIKRHNNDEI